MTTISQQLTELVNQKNALAANLTTKGVEASSSETLNTLVPKVLEIQGGGGESKVPEYMSAKNFTFDGNACTGWVGPSDITTIVIPKSYSKKTKSFSLFGAPVKKSRVIQTLNSFTTVVFCKSNGSNLKTYTSTSQLSSNFNTDFPTNDVVIQQLTVGLMPFNSLKNKLSEILVAPFIASTSNENPKTYYNSVSDFTSTLSPTTRNAYFNGTAEQTEYFDGDDYSVNIIRQNNTALSPKFENLYGIILPDSITTIADFGLISSKKLSAITIPSGVTTIGTRAFYTCSNLEQINVNSMNNAYYSSNGVLYNKAQTTLILYPSSKNNADYSILSTVTSITEFSFYNCTNLILITIPASVTEIGNSAFRDCKNLQSVNFGDNSQLQSIGDYAFNGCSSLTSVTIPEGVTEIGDSAFENCTSLTSITLPSSLTSIGTSAFVNCRSLTSITIPEGVTSIGTLAFDDCTSLTIMRIEAITPPTLSSTNAISTATTQIQVPMASVDAYKTATNWSNFADIIVGYAE